MTPGREPYIALWPQLQQATESEDVLLFSTTKDWRSGDDVSDFVKVPSDISLPFMPHMKNEKIGGLSMRSMHYPETYPEKFPFGPRPPGVETTKPKSGWKIWRR